MRTFSWFRNVIVKFRRVSPPLDLAKNIWTDPQLGFVHLVQDFSKFLYPK